MDAALSHPLMNCAENIYLGVWEHNLGAQRFYKSYGFNEVGEYLFEVESGTPADRELIMLRHYTYCTSKQ